MKRVGVRQEPRLLRKATGEALTAGARFSESLAQFTPTTYIPKGIYRFASHLEANEHQHQCVARGMALHAQGDLGDQSTSRAVTRADVHALMSRLATYRVDSLLIGGYALAAHGYVRGTSDIDLLCRADAVTCQRLQAAMSDLADQAVRHSPAQWLEPAGYFRIVDAFVVDILFEANGQTYENLFEYRQIFGLEGIPVQTVSLEGLLLTKQTPRPEDVEDRSVLEHAIETLPPLRSDNAPS